MKSTPPLVIPSVFNQIDMAKLPPFLRVLLMTDGTVTLSLEAFFWEHILVETTRQSSCVSDGSERYIGAPAGEPAIEREVELVGKTSGRVYASAKSIIRSDLLPPSIATALQEGEIGVGELIRGCGLETFREIVAVGEHRCADELGAIWRRYHIVKDGKPFITITEHFPLSLYSP